jgi:uncharacterized protein YuzE
MSRFATSAPGFAAEVAAALAGEGRADLSQQLESVEIDRLTYDARDDAGYIYFKRGPVSLHFAKLAAPVAETVVFHSEHGFNVDVDHDGDLFGIELLGRGELMAKLLAERAP